VLTKIKTDLLATKNVDGLDVNVDVKDGRVTLSGTASSEAERTKAESIAKGTKGVMSVENKIVLKNR
jgi:hyperosmotically inducible protein